MALNRVQVKTELTIEEWRAVERARRRFGCLTTARFLRLALAHMAAHRRPRVERRAEGECSAW